MKTIRKGRLFFHKITNWEYWPFQVIYIPIYFQWAFYSIKAKSIFFCNASNPTITNGGFVMESKKEIYDLIPQKYYPKTELIKTDFNLEYIISIIENSGMKYPFIAKPDVGLRGTAVKKINNSNDLKVYAEKANFDYVIQEFIPYENEIGVFYVRYPNQKEGKITGIVDKEFLIVTGDGKSTIAQLLLKNPRYELQFDVLKQEYGGQLQKVLPKGEKHNLVPYGNHARGTKFTDISHKNSVKLTQTFNEMCTQIPGFYFGRLDVMYSSFEELENGINFQIVELNGSGSEPTHIYDPKHSLFFAWKELMRHIKYMFEISVENNKLGFPYLSHKEGMQQYRLQMKQINTIVKF